MLLAGRKIANNGHEEGRLLLKELYKQYTNAPMPNILYTEKGKPYFETGDVHFSITHTRHHVFCALAAHPIGIDAEELNRDVNLRLAEKILSPDEKAQFDAASDPRRALLTFWVLKEAAAKQSGIGLNGYPNHTHFSLDDPRVTESHGCLLAIIET